MRAHGGEDGFGVGFEGSNVEAGLEAFAAGFLSVRLAVTAASERRPFQPGWRSARQLASATLQERSSIQPWPASVAALRAQVAAQAGVDLHFMGVFLNLCDGRDHCGFPTLSEHSYGFRPERSAHQAVAHAQRYIAGGYNVVVDLDLEKFFDRVQSRQPDGARRRASVR